MLKIQVPQLIVQLSLSSSYCTSDGKSGIVQFCYSFNFATKTFIVWLVIYNITVIKMWPNELFVDSYKGLSWKNM